MEHFPSVVFPFCNRDCADGLPPCRCPRSTAALSTLTSFSRAPRSPSPEGSRKSETRVPRQRYHRESFVETIPSGRSSAEARSKSPGSVARSFSIFTRPVPSLLLESRCSAAAGTFRWRPSVSFVSARRVPRRLSPRQRPAPPMYRSQSMTTRLSLPAGVPEAFSWRRPRSFLPAPRYLQIQVTLLLSCRLHRATLIDTRDRGYTVHPR